jgi:DNA polymerase elongation subunit (family B)
LDPFVGFFLLLLVATLDFASLYPSIMMVISALCAKRGVLNMQTQTFDNIATLRFVLNRHTISATQHLFSAIRSIILHSWIQILSERGSMQKLKKRLKNTLLKNVLKIQTSPLKIWF